MFITTAVDLFQEVPRAMQKQTGLRKLRNSIIMNTYTRSQHITHSNKGIRYINGHILAEKLFCHVENIPKMRENITLAFWIRSVK